MKLSSVIVVVPEEWMAFHDLQDPDCWCKPDVIWENGTPVIVHQIMSLGGEFWRTERIPSARNMIQA